MQFVSRGSKLSMRRNDYLCSRLSGPIIVLAPEGLDNNLEEQGWRSGESTRSQPLRPDFLFGQHFFRFLSLPLFL